MRLREREGGICAQFLHDLSVPRAHLSPAQRAMQFSVCDLVKLIDQLYRRNLHVYSGTVRNIFETCPRTFSVITLVLSLSLFLLRTRQTRYASDNEPAGHDRANCLIKNARAARRSRGNTVERDGKKIASAPKFLPYNITRGYI